MTTTTITPTTERNEAHNYRTAEMSDVLGHEVCNAIHGLETVRAMAHALGEALPDEPGDKADPDKVRELTRRTLDTWREVRMLTTNGEAVEEPSTEQIDLEVASMTIRPDEPERLAITAASAVAAAGTLFSIHAQALLDSRSDTTG